MISVTICLISLAEKLILNHRIARILCCLFLLWPFAAGAQRFPFYNFTIEHGLVQSQATAIAQDRSGNLWVGTLGGLSRFDGKKFTSYSVVDGLLSNTIYSLAFSRSGKLLISSAGGIQLFDGKIFTTVLRAAKNKRFNPVLLPVDRPEEAWFVLDGKVYSVKTPEQPLALFPANTLINDLEVKAGVVYAAVNGNTLYTLDLNSLAIRDSAQATDPQLTIIRVLTDRHRKIWLLCNKGLYCRSAESN
jgi:hypothetical protein